MNDPVDDILDLVAGKAGPYLENESSYFGRMRYDSSMKDKPIEQDCGGMIITKSKMTYGEADELAVTVDLSGFVDFISRCQPSCYHELELNGSFYRGVLWWVIYSYLATNKIIQGDPNSYYNPLEYLYELILQRLIADGILRPAEKDRYYFVNGIFPTKKVELILTDEEIQMLITACENQQLKTMLQKLI